MSDRVGERIQCEREWILGERIGGGGFGEVYAAESSDGKMAAAKLVPKAPGADRELLFADVTDAPHVVPVIDRGEHDGQWVLVMPRADMSLRDRLDQASDDPIDVAEMLGVLGESRVGWCIAI